MIHESHFKAPMACAAAQPPPNTIRAMVPRNPTCEAIACHTSCQVDSATELCRTTHLSKDDRKGLWRAKLQRVRKTQSQRCGAIDVQIEGWENVVDLQQAKREYKRR